MFDKPWTIILGTLIVFGNGHLYAKNYDDKVFNYVSSLIDAGTCQPGWIDDFEDCLMRPGIGADEAYRQLQESVQKLKAETAALAIIRRESVHVASIWFLKDPDGKNSPILFYVDLGLERLRLKKMFQYKPSCGFDDYVGFVSERNNWLAKTFASILGFVIENYQLPNGETFKLDRMLRSWGSPLELDAEVVVNRLKAIDCDEYARRFIYLEPNEDGLRLCFTVGQTDYTIGVVRINKGSFIYMNQEY